MKIAVCLSGQPRFAKEGVQNITKNLLEPNGISDIFIHAWKAERFASAQPHYENRWGWQPGTEEILLSLKPKQLLIQEDYDFKQFADLANLPTAIQTKLASMFYSSFRANQLKQEHEELCGKKYDLIIKTRLDINYHKPVVLSELDLDLSGLNVSQMHQQIRIDDSYPISNGGNYSSMSDTWIAGSSKSLDGMMETLYRMFAVIHSHIKPFQYGECYLGYARHINLLPIKMVDVPYNLMR
jgi:hypothetical protein